MTSPDPRGSNANRQTNWPAGTEIVAVSALKPYARNARIRIFSHTLVEVMANGQKETMDRQTALLNKMFESAMKGGVTTPWT